MKKLICCLLFSALVACSGGNSPVSRGSSSSTGGGGGSSSSSTSSTATVIRIGSGSGVGFSNGTIGLSATSISAGGSATLSVSLVDQNGVPYTQSAIISFSSPCLTANTAVIKDQSNAIVSSITTTTGSATVTYVAQGCSGSDNITASTTVNSQPTLSATGTITVQAAVLGAVTFVSASPASIGLKGTGVQETSTLVFQVSDSSGGPVNGAAVTFSLSTSVGGLSLSTTTATSGADGKVQTVVKSGTVHTSVRVTASATLGGVTQSTQSNNLTVSTGIPTTNAFSVAPVCPNVEAWNTDGVVSPITVRLADRYNNPVPDGTSIALMAEGGKIDPQCNTKTTATESGVCTVNWTSQNPRPIDGRVTILATALGEDSFVDANANGFFDTGESYIDRGEPYEDDDESGSYQLGEPFLDFTGNLTRDATYGSFKGITCTGITSSSTCTLVNASIGGQAVIVMSGSVATITGPATATGAPDAQIQLNYNVHDLHGNAMPSGTTIAVTANSNAGQLAQPTSFTVPCDPSIGGTDVTVILTIPSASPTKTGLLTVTVTTPAGLVTVFRTTIN